jgi:hypothetical protein
MPQAAWQFDDALVLLELLKKRFPRGQIRTQRNDTSEKCP